MRRLRRGDRSAREKALRGFTLVEALLVVAIVAILGMLATFGVRKYLAMARSAEAIQVVGMIARAVTMSSDRLQAGASTQPSPVLCKDAITVPIAFTPVRSKTYMPDSRPGMDYNTGDQTTGWTCLGFENTRPHHYQYRYRLGGAPIALPGHARIPAGIGLNDRWCAYARGDLDGDGVFSWFLIDGYVKDGRFMSATSVVTLDPDE